MDNTIVLLLAGLVVGTLGTLIGAGGGFLLVPLLIITHPALPPDIVTAISIAIVAANAISGSIAYGRSGRIDFRAGILFALFTIPGSILGVYATSYIPQKTFHVVFGVLLLALSAYLLISGRRSEEQHPANEDSGVHNVQPLHYNRYIGIAISIVVGFLSPLLGIGGGIIHVPALVRWLKFPVHVATATSHFILAVMATVSVITHAQKGNYHDPAVWRMVVLLSLGAIVGAQAGATLSQKVKGNFIIQALAVCLGIVGLRILLVP